MRNIINNKFLRNGERIDILLINPYPDYSFGTLERTIYPPLGLLYMATLLNQKGFKAKVLDANILRIKQDEVLNIVYETMPFIVGISANIVTSRAALILSENIKKLMPKVTLILGGPLPTALPEIFLKNGDLVVRGEGEETLIEIVEKLFNKIGTSNFQDIHNLSGISLKVEDRIIHNPSRPLIYKLDKIPLPDYKLLHPHLIFYSKTARSRAVPVAPIFTSRGCPYHCIYCNHNIFGHLFRARSAENVLEEIKYLVREYKIKQLDILDDNFTYDIPRAEKILNLILDENISILINCQNGIRADRVNYKLVKKMKKAGVFKVAIGIESADEQILKKIKKHLRLEEAYQTIQWFRKEGIVVHTDFLMGLPGDTPQTMQKNIDFALRSNPHIAIFALPIPFPGTELYQEIKEKGVFLQNPEYDSDAGFYGGKVFFETALTRAEDVLKFYKKAYLKFYFRLSKIWDIIKNTKSKSELQWIIFTSYYVLKSLIKGKFKREKQRRKRE